MLTVLLIWLGWQMVVGLLVQRSPVETAIRVAPSSGQVLSRAAEAEMVAGRVDAARDLAGMALRAAPFDVRALRVLGLAVAQTDPAAADDLLTLAGNWSLRDDPSHAWLIRRRLEQGDYAGAFGHADALARRREDVHPRIFQFFTVAVAEDPRAAPHLIARLIPRPNWRTAYLDSLRTGAQAPQVQATLALGLERTPGRMNNLELQTIYGEWVRQGRLPGVRELHRRLRRPLPAPLQDGGFEDPAAPRPFKWMIETGPGSRAEMSADAQATGKALFVETDGFSTRTVVSQLLLLDPGPQVLTGRFRFEAGGQDPRLSWSIRCLETNAVIATWSPTATQDQSEWATARTSFTVPSVNCTTQWIELKTRRGSRRSAVVAWFDTFALAPSPAKTTGN
ncbi:MAG: hypothetical protein K2X07_04010 [Caulobacteraceae bacterium]|nr:hypothetical protein [Caulobacteraceae bacterium]